MSNPFIVGDEVTVQSGMSKKLVGLTGKVVYTTHEWCEVDFEDRKDYERVHYSALMHAGDYPRRAEAEVLRDSVLKLSASLNASIGGAETLKEDKIKFPKFVEKIEKEQFTKGCRTEEKAILPEDAQARKEIPLYSGLMRYFPRALCAVAHQSYLGNQQHHPDKPLHWDRSKSSDEEDALLRHMVDKEWVQVAWRALARLEKELEK